MEQKCNSPTATHAGPVLHTRHVLTFRTLPSLSTPALPAIYHVHAQLTYEHDGSHPEHYRGWGRMMGEITHVYDPPEVSVCVCGSDDRLSLIICLVL